jgi:hypothetical protein
MIDFWHQGKFHHVLPSALNAVYVVADNAQAVR